MSRSSAISVMMNSSLAGTKRAVPATRGMSLDLASPEMTSKVLPVVLFLVEYVFNDLGT